MATITLRPNAVYSQAGMVASAGALEAAASDSSDATWVTDTAGGGFYNCGIEFDLGTSALPAGAVIKRVTPFVRASQAVGSAPLLMQVEGGTFFFGWSYSSPQTLFVPTSTIQTFQGADAGFFGGAYDLSGALTMSVQTLLDGLKIAILSQSPTADDHRIYDAWVVVEYNLPPVASALALSPADGATRTTRPGFSWTYSDPESDPYAAYRLIVHEKTDTLDSVFQAGLANNVVYGAFVDSNGNTIYSKGGTGAAATGGYGDTVAYSNATSYTLTTDLENGKTYRAYLQVADAIDSNYKWSTPIFVEFTMAVSLPPAPDLTANFQAATALVQLIAQGRMNMLSTNAASLETDTTGWFASVNSTISRSTAQADDGAASLSISANSAGNIAAATSVGNRPKVTPGVTYTALARFRAATVARVIRVDIFYYDASNVVVGSVAGAITLSDTTTGWTESKTQLVAPAGADMIGVQTTILSAAGAGEVHYIDKIAIAPGTTSQVNWSRGGLAQTAVLAIDRSTDGGVTWTGVPNASGVFTPTYDIRTQALTVYDTVAPPGKNVQYRAYARGSDLGNYLQSPASATTSALATPRTKWWLADPLDYTKRVPVQILGDLSGSYNEAQGVFQPLGSDRYIVISDGIGGPITWQVRAIFKTDADWLTFEQLRKDRNILALMGDVQDAYWWVRIGGQVDHTLINNTGRKVAATRARYMNASLYEVDPPYGLARLP